jgi:hypothetical protein
MGMNREERGFSISIKINLGVVMKDRAPSTLEVIGAAFLAMSVPIFVIVGAIAYGLFQR